MNLDTQATQPLQLLDDVGSGGTAQDAATQSEVGGVNGDVEGTEALLGQAIPVVFGEVGQSDEIAEQEGIAIVVVLNVEGAPHPRRHPVEKAKLAAIVAAAQAVESWLGELNAWLLVVAPLHLVDAPLPTPFYDQLQFFLSSIETVINDVAQDVAIDGEKHIARLQAQLRSDTA